MNMMAALCIAWCALYVLEDIGFEDKFGKGANAMWVVEGAMVVISFIAALGALAYVFQQL